MGAKHKGLARCWPVVNLNASWIFLWKNEKNIEKELPSRQLLSEIGFTGKVTLKSSHERALKSKDLS
jgi:hypothetical protein